MSVKDNMFFVFLLCFLPSIFGMDTSGLDMNNYGSYTLKYEKIATCKGSKPPCGNIDIINSHNLSNIIFTMDVHRECVLGMVRIVMTAMPISGPKTNKQIINYTIYKPCQHFVVGPVLRQAYGDEAMRKCVMPQGNYTRQFNLSGLSEKFFGPKFFYGTYKFRVITNNRKYHILCYESEVSVKPNI